MTEVEQGALIVGLAWLGILSFVVLLIARQISLMTIRLTMLAPYNSADEDAIELGTELPAAFLHRLMAYADRSDTNNDRIAANGSDVSPLSAGEDEGTRIIFLSGTCSTCRSIAADLSPGAISRTVIFIGGSQEHADRVAALLPEGASVVRDPEASAAADALEIESVPFALSVRKGVVTSKTYLHSVNDLGRLSDLPDSGIERRRSGVLGNVLKRGSHSGENLRAKEGAAR